MLGFGIIGCGMIAKFHAKAIGDVRGARLVACYDQFPAAADKLAEATGCKAYHSLDEMLADPAVDVVTIGTPSGAHMEPAVAAARSDRHTSSSRSRWKSPFAVAMQSSRLAGRPMSCSQRSSPRGSTTRPRS